VGEPRHRRNRRHYTLYNPRPSTDSGTRNAADRRKITGPMDSFASDRKLSELGELDLQDLLDQSDLFDDDEQRQLANRRRTSHDTDAGDCVSSLAHVLSNHSRPSVISSDSF